MGRGRRLRCKNDFKTNVETMREQSVLVAVNGVKGEMKGRPGEDVDARWG